MSSPANSRIQAECILKEMMVEIIFLVFQVIDAISAAIIGTSGCSLLDVDPGASTNRTVYTFVGSPEAVVEGALNGARQAFSLIDMSKHSGQQHPDTTHYEVLYRRKYLTPVCYLFR